MVVLAWIYAKGDDKLNAGREPLRANAQLVPEKIHLLAVTDNGLVAGTADGLSTPKTTPAETCHAYAGATVKEAQQIAESLAAKLPEARIAANPVVRPSSFEVAIVGLASQAAVDTKLAELKKLDIKEVAQIQLENDRRYTVLLASAADRSAAEESLKSLTKKGVTGLTVVERKSPVEKSVIEIRGSDNALKKLSEQMASFKNLSPTVCAAQ